MKLSLMRFCVSPQEERTPLPGLLAISRWPTLSSQGYWEIEYIDFSPSKVEEMRGERYCEWILNNQPTMSAKV